MSARKDARKEFAKEQELERLRAKKESQQAFLASLTPEELAARKKSGNKKMLIGAAIVAAIIIAIAIGGGSKSSTDTSTSTTTTTTATDAADAGASLGCDHFRNITSDAAKGLLTDAELRDKLKQVYSDAEVSSNSGISSGATEMLSAITSGDTTAFTTAINDFSAACTAVGH